MSFWRAGFWRAGFWRGGYWRGMGAGSDVVQPLSGQRVDAVAGSTGATLSLDLVGRRVTLAQGGLTPVVATSGTVLLEGLRVVARGGGFQVGERADNYFLYVLTAPPEIVAREIAPALFVVLPVEIEPVQVEDDDAAVRTPLVEVQAEVDSVEAWVLRSPVELVAFTEPVVIFAVTMPDTPTATTDTPESVVQTPPVELLAA